ncbi:MAG: hypothetical protein L6437_10275 [Kiritimatiellae bacterium]|nr:hypothetical protein [Kiritimatiellia bacterium]
MSTRYNFNVFRSWATDIIRVFVMPATLAKPQAWRLAWLVGLLWSGGIMSRADTHYVSLDGDNTSPYTNGWASAATQIQWAMDQAIADDTVLVSNGTYTLTNQIEITNNLTVQSLNGTNFTFVNGNYPDYSNRCVFMLAGTLDGFTISNGYLAVDTTNYPNSHIYGAVGGAGIGTRGTVTIKNCYIHNNVISNATAGGGGGGIHNKYSYAVVSNCTIVNNTCGVGLATDIRGGGINGGAYSQLIIDSYHYCPVKNPCKYSCFSG